MISNGNFCGVLNFILLSFRLVPIISEREFFKGFNLFRLVDDFLNLSSKISFT